MKCPGQDSRYWKPESIFETNCPQCNEPVEFFKDDPTRKCTSCGHKFVNPNMDFGCAAYCRFADTCIGELPPELLAQREGLMKDRIAIEMKKHLNKDFKNIGRASRVARHAEAIAADAGGDMAIILAAAYLHCVGAREALQKHGSTEYQFLEIESPPIAKTIMEKIGAHDGMTEEVIKIIGHFSKPEDQETVNFKIVHDANQIADMEMAYKEKNIAPEALRKNIETRLCTDSARKYAETLFRE